MKEKLMAQVLSFLPGNPQEEADKALFLSWLRQDADITVRENLTAHLTASAWVVSPDRQKVLMAYHNLYGSWAWLGGHADGSWDLQQVARREAEEESGITGLRAVTDSPVSLEILNVSGHEKKGRYVPSHLHLNLTYIFEGDPEAPIRCKADENSGVDWIHIDDIPKRSTETWFVERIYSKLIRRSLLL